MGEEWVCKKRKIGDIFEIECIKGEKTERLICIFGTEGKSGGASALGFGAQYGEQDTTIKCFSEEEIREEVAKKLGTSKNKIKWLDE